VVEEVLQEEINAAEAKVMPQAKKIFLIENRRYAKARFKAVFGENNLETGFRQN
jgi:hypothetical protein